MGVDAAGLSERIKKIRVIVFDVDGVLTDGRIIYDAKGTEIKAFDVKDGHGIKLAMRAGLDVGLITARDSEVVKLRAKELGIKLLYQGMKDKRAALREILDATGAGPEEVAYTGDDVIDLPVLSRAGLAVAVSDAVEEVLRIAHYVTKRPGGRGAARELIELILKGQGKWDQVIKGYLE